VPFRGGHGARQAAPCCNTVPSAFAHPTMDFTLGNLIAV
jgi:hypothetical protein